MVAWLAVSRTDALPDLRPAPFRNWCIRSRPGLLSSAVVLIGLIYLFMVRLFCSQAVPAAVPRQRRHPAVDRVRPGDSLRPRPRPAAGHQRQGRRVRVSIATLEDMRVLHDGFDLCAPDISVSMTINGRAGHPGDVPQHRHRRGPPRPGHEHRRFRCPTSPPPPPPTAWTAEYSVIGRGPPGASGRWRCEGEKYGASTPRAAAKEDNHMQDVRGAVGLQRRRWTSTDIRTT